MNSYDFFIYEFICFMNSYMNSGVPRFQRFLQVRSGPHLENCRVQSAASGQRSGMSVHSGCQPPCALCGELARQVRRIGILRPFSVTTLRVGAVPLGPGPRGRRLAGPATAERAGLNSDPVLRALEARRSWRIGSRPARAGSVLAWAT